MLILTRYITEKGSINTEFYKVVHNIIDTTQIKIFEREVIPYFNNMIMVLRGLSDFNQIITNSTELKTEEYSIKLESPAFNFVTLNEPAYGSERECIERNITLYTQSECFKVQTYFESIKVNLVNPDIKSDEYDLALSQVRSSGIHTYCYTIKFKFNSDWSPTCTSCNSGMLYLRNELSKIQDQLYAVDDDTIKADGRLIYDLNVGNKDLLKRDIKLLLSNALYDARIDDIELVDLTLGGINETQETHVGPEELRSETYVNLL